MNNHFIYVSPFISKIEFIENSETLVYNGASNQFIYYTDNKFQNIIELKELSQITKESLQSDFIFAIYAKIFDSFIKIELNVEDTSIKLFPLKPLILKEVKGNDKELIDLGYYIKLTLQFCENFPLNEFYSK